MNPSGSPLEALRRINSARPPVNEGERCDMCSAPVADEHQHVVDLNTRSLMCTCRPCYLLFTDTDAQMRYRAVPDRYLAFPGFVLDQGDWDDLQIPVGLAFLFKNTAQGRVVAFYPSPAGATESELSMTAWDRVLEANPGLGTVLPDVEALLVRGTREDEGFSAHVLPIDTCYELVGRMRMTWRGFDGGQEAREALEEFFAMVDARSVPAEARP